MNAQYDCSLNLLITLNIRTSSTNILQKFNIYIIKLFTSFLRITNAFHSVYTLFNVSLSRTDIYPLEPTKKTASLIKYAQAIFFPRQTARRRFSSAQTRSLLSSSFATTSLVAAGCVFIFTHSRWSMLRHLPTLMPCGSRALWSIPINLTYGALDGSFLRLIFLFFFSVASEVARDCVFFFVWERASMNYDVSMTMWGGEVCVCFFWMCGMRGGAAICGRYLRHGTSF